MNQIRHEWDNHAIIFFNMKKGSLSIIIIAILKNITQIRKHDNFLVKT